MGQKKKKKKSASDLNFENELRKAKLQLEKGAHIQSNGNIPPELESIFLDHIEKFDKAYRNSKPISIFEKLGKPVFKPASRITEKGIKKELGSMMKKLNRKGIMVESICKIEDREMYRFITEELFWHKINNISIKGMMTHFTYEEFHPNHEHDIKSLVEEFIRDILSEQKRVEVFYIGLNFKSVSGENLGPGNALEKLNFIRSFYSRFKLENFEFTGLRFTTKMKRCNVNFNLAYTATIEGSNEKQTFSGQGKAIMSKSGDHWFIHQFEMPGIQL